jgi:hypothetical protein
MLVFEEVWILGENRTLVGLLDIGLQRHQPFAPRFVETVLSEFTLPGGRVSGTKWCSAKISAAPTIVPAESAKGMARTYRHLVSGPVPQVDGHGPRLAVGHAVRQRTAIAAQ